MPLKTTLPDEENPDTKYAPVIRTDFSNDALTQVIFEKALTGNIQYGFKAYLILVQDRAFEGFNPRRIKEGLPERFGWAFIFILDAMTTTHPDHPFLCLNLQEETLDNTFRVILGEMWRVENNLTLANMDFYEFADSVDEGGILRAFPEVN